MANVMLKLGGPYRYNRSSLARQTTYQGDLNGAAHRVAGEYHHGYFTIGNSFNPHFSIGQAEALKNEATGVGDFIGLFVIPHSHLLLDVAVKTVPVQLDRGYTLARNTDGLTFDVEVRKYDYNTLKETGVLELDTPLTGIDTAEHTFKRSSVAKADLGYFIPHEEVLVLGLKVKSLPSNSTISLFDVTSRVEVTGHVLDYEAPIHV